MDNLKESTIFGLFCDKEQTIKAAWKKMDVSGQKLILVVDADRKLLGIVTDGDIRRALLNEKKLDYKIKNLMNETPKYVLQHSNDKRHDIIAAAKHILVEYRLDGVPVLNNKNQVIDCIFLSDYIQEESNEISSKCPVVIMAGGKGTRMAPYTKVIPKPLIPLGSQPIIKHIMGTLYTYGLNKFHISINYKADLIKAFFSADQFKSNVSFFQEDKPLGTAGSLKLIKDKLTETFVVTNCDILTSFNIEELLEFHKKEKSLVTTVSSLKQIQIPYGVVEIGPRGKIKKMTEKPEIDVLVNIGFYILEPEVLNYIPDNEFFHMTDLMQAIMDNNGIVNSFPISEKSWTDLGQMNQYLNYITEFNNDEKETINCN